MTLSFEPAAAEPCLLADLPKTDVLSLDRFSAAG
jgi:hypothetical protein